MGSLFALRAGEGSGRARLETQKHMVAVEELRRLDKRYGSRAVHH